MAADIFEPWQRAFIEKLRVARLATVASSGYPALVPVCYALVADQLVIAIDEKPKSTTSLARLRNIGRDPRVSILFDRYDEDWTKLAWVRVEGEASVGAAGAGRPDALQALRERYPQYRQMDLESRPLVVVQPRTVVAWRWESG